MIRLWVCWSLRVSVAVGYLLLCIVERETARDVVLYAAILAVAVCAYDFWRWRRDRCRS